MDQVSPARGHEVEDHTADARIHVWALDLQALFEEAASALGALTVDVAGLTASRTVDVELTGSDLEQLAFDWLNELIGLSEVERSGVSGTEVESVTTVTTDEGAAGWRLRARVVLQGFDDVRVRALRHAKAATYHGLRVERTADRWEMDAVLDL